MSEKSETNKTNEHMRYAEMMDLLQSPAAPISRITLVAEMSQHLWDSGQDEYAAIVDAMHFDMKRIFSLLNTYGRSTTKPCPKRALEICTLWTEG